VCSTGLTPSRLLLLPQALQQDWLPSSNPEVRIVSAISPDSAHGQHICEVYPPIVDHMFISTLIPEEAPSATLQQVGIVTGGGFSWTFPVNPIAKNTRGLSQSAISLSTKRGSISIE
jgi:hypothetical protein